jgi:hypothetical protein
LIEKTCGFSKGIWPYLFLSFRWKPWFDKLTTLSIAEGESSGASNVLDSGFRRSDE